MNLAGGMELRKFLDHTVHSLRVMTDIKINIWYFRSTFQKVSQFFLRNSL